MTLVLHACLFVLGTIHLLPLSGVLGAQRLAALYGVTIDEPNLQILMRHRAVLFGVLGALQLAAIGFAPLQATALATGWISVGSFVWLCGVGPHNAHLGRVVLVDWFALGALLIGTAAFVARNG